MSSFVVGSPLSLLPIYSITFSVRSISFKVDIILGMESTGKPDNAPTRLANDEEGFLFAMQLTFIADVPRILRATIQLGLLEVISEAGRPVTAAEIVAHIPAKDPAGAAAMVDRMLSLLASYNIVSCSLSDLPSGKAAERLYGLSPACKFLMKNKDGASLVPLIYLNCENAIIQSW